jgi:hypothetical protein
MNFQGLREQRLSLKVLTRRRRRATSRDFAIFLVTCIGWHVGRGSVFDLHRLFRIFPWDGLNLGTCLVDGSRPNITRIHITTPSPLDSKTVGLHPRNKAGRLTSANLTIFPPAWLATARHGSKNTQRFSRLFFFSFFLSPPPSPATQSLARLRPITASIVRPCDLDACGV